MNQSILRLPVVKVRTGLSRTCIYKAISEGNFPRPLALGRRAVGWLDSDISAWIASRPVAGGAVATPTKRKGVA